MRFINSYQFSLEIFRFPYKDCKLIVPKCKNGTKTGNLNNLICQKMHKTIRGTNKYNMMMMMMVYVLYVCYKPVLVCIQNKGKNVSHRNNVYKSTTIDLQY